jgi:hypothetical protein
MAINTSRLGWLSGSVFFICWAGFWYAEQAMFPYSNGGVGGLFGFVIAGLIAALIDRYRNRIGERHQWRLIRRFDY